MTLIAKEILGCSDAIRMLNSSVKNNSLSHAYLITGEDGVGKTTLAMALGYSANCKDLKQEDSDISLCYCGKCSSCFKMINFSHPDYTFIRAENDTIKINQIRKIQTILSKVASEAKFKVCIIDEADKMTEEAQNCLLKTLEEPQGDTLIILTAKKIYSLLPTILSRCCILNLYPTEKDTIEKWLCKEFFIEDEKAKLVASISGGFPGKALGIILDTDYFQIRKQIVKFIVEILKNGTASYAVKGSDELLEFIKKEVEKIQKQTERTEEINLEESQSKTSKRKKIKEKKDQIFTGKESLKIVSNEGCMSLIASLFSDVMRYKINSCESYIDNLDYMSEIKYISQRLELNKCYDLVSKAIENVTVLKNRGNSRMIYNNFALDLVLI